MKILDNFKSKTVSFFTNQTKILRTIKSKMESGIISGWTKLGKDGQLTFLALLSYVTVLIYYFGSPHVVPFLIKKATSWQLIFLLVLLLFFAAMIRPFIIKKAIGIVKKIVSFVHANIKFVKIFYINTTKPFVDKDTSEHSFRVVDAILKYFGVIATLAAVIGFATSYISSQETAKTEREKMLNELFYKAIEQTNSSNANVNLAGIYSLEQSATDFPKNQWKVVDLLTNYIKQHPSKLDKEKLLETLKNEYIEKHINELITKESIKDLLNITKTDTRSLVAYKNKGLRFSSAKDQQKVISLFVEHIKRYPSELDEARLLVKLKKEYTYKYTKEIMSRKSVKEQLKENLYVANKDTRSLAPYKKKDPRVQAALGVICRRKLENDKDLFESIHDKYNEIRTNMNSYPGTISNRIIPLATDLNDSMVSDLSSYDMSGCNFHRVSLNRATVHNANMNNIDLSKSYLYKTSLISSELRNADLEESQLTKANLTETHLNNSILINANLTNANLQKSILTSAKLINATMIETSLVGSYLKKADITRANLTRANLTRANLTEANLSDVNLKQANLDMANLTRSNLTGSQNLDKDQIKQACYWKSATYSPKERQSLKINEEEESPVHQQKCKDKWGKKNSKEKIRTEIIDTFHNLGSTQSLALIIN